MALPLSVTLWLVALSGLTHTIAIPQPEPVTIDSGHLCGVALEGGIVVYRGVPYAAPPVGDLRWRAPQAAAAWEGVRVADTFGPISPQGSMIAMMSGEPLPETSEDCLYLNVWTTAEKAEAGRPVMVWIHGGGFVGGWGSQQLYQGAASLAQQGVVVVTLNYRLGALGFLSHPELKAESKESAFGNYGLLDQIAALHWVQRNIKAFGGDPGRVTIFGESAGGTSVAVLCASPLAKGLFRGAIAQSPWISIENFAPTGAEAPRSAEARGLQLARRLARSDEAPSLETLRALDTEAIFRRTDASYQPWVTIDGHLLTDRVEEIFARGEQNRVALIAGTTADEGTMFQTSFPYRTVPQYVDGMKEIFGAFASRILETYPAPSDDEVATRTRDIIRDLWFLRGCRSMLAGSARAGSPTYQYEFQWSNPLLPDMGAHHAAELAFVFGQLPAGAPKRDVELAGAIQAYWVDFAKTGDPNGEGRHSWPRWTDSKRPYLMLGSAIHAGNDLHAKTCDVLEEYRKAGGEKR
ncbi:MAG: carboxylesterase family protein [Planctomycetota bacterium]